MAVYNGQQFLDDAVRSVLAQTFPDWELVIVDDGSTDRTGAIADRWAASDPRIRVIHQSNSGLPAAARNTGMAEARGEILTFLDGDDLYHPDRIRRQLIVLDACPEVGGAFHDFRWFADGTDPEGGNTYLARQGYVESARDFLEERVTNGETIWVGSDELIKFMSSETVGIHTSTIAIRREVLSSLTPPGFRVDLPHCEDIDMWLRISRQTRLAVFPVPLSYYRHNPAGWMATKDRAIRLTGSFAVKREMLERLEQMLRPEEWPRYREKMAERWTGVAYGCLVAGLLPQARFAYRQALRIGEGKSVRRRAVKGLLVSLVPRPLRRSYWRITGGGEFAEGSSPPP